jgi:hypothetical protein
MRQLVLIISLATMVGLGGCTSIKKLTGQTNDTVLPGQREDVLAPDQQTARDPVVTGQEEKPCDPQIETCPDLMPQ